MSHFAYKQLSITPHVVAFYAAPYNLLRNVIYFNSKISMQKASLSIHNMNMNADGPSGAGGGGGAVSGTVEGIPCAKAIY